MYNVSIGGEGGSSKFRPKSFITSVAALQNQLKLKRLKRWY
jgi:hypothetical protein